MATYSDPTAVVSTPAKPETVGRASILGLIAAILALLMGGFFYYQLYRTNSQIKTVENSITQNKTALKALDATATELKGLSQSAKDLHLLFDNQQRWTIVLGKVQERLYRDMAVTALQMNENGTVTLSGIVPDYTGYAKVFRSLTDDAAKQYFSSAKPTSINRLGDKDKNLGVAFTFALSLSQNVLNAKNAAPQEDN